MCNATLRRVCVVAMEQKYILHILSVSVVLVVQHAVRMHCIMLLSLACPALRHFSTVSHNWHDFWEKSY